MSRLEPREYRARAAATLEAGVADNVVAIEERFLVVRHRMNIVNRRRRRLLRPRRPTDRSPPGRKRRVAATEMRGARA
jgi:hypothetical protein